MLRLLLNAGADVKAETDAGGNEAVVRLLSSGSRSGGR